MTQKMTLLVACIVVLASCKKESTPVDKTPDKPKPAYSVENIRPIMLKHGLDSARLKLSILNLTDMEQTSSISLGNIPEDVVATIDEPLGVLPYNPQITMNAFFAKPGKYEYNIFTTTGKEETITHTAQLTINEMDSKECAVIFYNALVLESGPAYAYKNLYGMHLYHDEQAGRIYIGDVFTLEILNYESAYSYTAVQPEIFIEPDCNNRTITIPRVTVIGVSNASPNDTRNYIISGEGMINHIDSSFSINFKINREDGTMVHKKWELKGKLKF